VDGIGWERWMIRKLRLFSERVWISMPSLLSFFFVRMLSSHFPFTRRKGVVYEDDKEALRISGLNECLRKVSHGWKQRKLGRDCCFALFA